MNPANMIPVPGVSASARILTQHPRSEAVRSRRRDCVEAAASGRTSSQKEHVRGDISSGGNMVSHHRKDSARGMSPEAFPSALTTRHSR